MTTGVWWNQKKSPLLLCGPAGKSADNKCSGRLWSPEKRYSLKQSYGGTISPSPWRNHGFDPGIVLTAWDARTGTSEEKQLRNRDLLPVTLRTDNRRQVLIPFQLSRAALQSAAYRSGDKELGKKELWGERVHGSSVTHNTASHPRCSRLVDGHLSPLPINLAPPDRRTHGESN